MVAFLYEGVCVVVCTCEPVLGQDRRALEVRLSLPDLVEEWGVELGLQLLVAVTLHNLSYFLFPPHVRRIVQVTFQALSPAHVDDCLAHEKPWGRGEKDVNSTAWRIFKHTFIPCLDEMTLPPFKLQNCSLLTLFHFFSSHFVTNFHSQFSYVENGNSINLWKGSSKLKKYRGSVLPAG